MLQLNLGNLIFLNVLLKRKLDLNGAIVGHNILIKSLGLVHSGIADTEMWTNVMEFLKFPLFTYLRSVPLVIVE